MDVSSLRLITCEEGRCHVKKMYIGKLEAIESWCGMNQNGQGTQRDPIFFTGHGEFRCYPLAYFMVHTEF